MDTAENRARPGSIADSGEASADSGDAFAGRVDAARRDVSVGREDAAWRDAVRAGTSLAPSVALTGTATGGDDAGLRPEPSAGEEAAGLIADPGKAFVDSGEASIERVDAARREDASVGRVDAARRDMPHDVMSFAPFAVQACARAGGGDAGLRPEPSTGEEDTGSNAAALESGAQTQRTDSSERSDDALREKLLRAHAGDAQAREELISENLALVRFLVKRFAGRGADMEDLFQYGCMGLIKAIDRFDPSFSVRFSTYAVPVILGEIRRFLRDDGPIHVSRTIHENARRVARFCDEWRAGHGETPDVGCVAEALALSREDVVLALNARSRVRSLSEPIGGEGDLRLMDVLGAEPMRDIDSRLTLAKLLRDLPDDERTLIVRRYFKSHTQTEIARDMGISQVQVSRLESRILKKMRLRAEGG